MGSKVRRNQYFIVGDVMSGLEAWHCKKRGIGRLSASVGKLIVLPPASARIILSLETPNT